MSPVRSAAPRRALFALALALAAPVSAGEAFVGVFAHNVDLPSSLQTREDGVDFQLGVRTAPIAHFLSADLRAHFFGSVNSDGGVDFAAAGLNLRFPLGDRFYFQPGLGIAVQDGSDAHYQKTEDKLYLGSRVLLEPEITFGWRASNRVSLELGWVHLSHAKIASGQNPGMDDLGARLVYRFGGEVE